jgi:replicative superfamily II helicase
MEEFHDLRSEKREDLLLAATEELVRRGEQVLVFVPDRATTVQSARVLAGRVSAGSTAPVLEELRQQEGTHARETLTEVVGSAVAFHNSDLSPEEREIVERHFRSGAIRAVFSTSTLAVGMNLPVKDVLLVGGAPFFSPPKMSEVALSRTPPA